MTINILYLSLSTMCTVSFILVLWFLSDIVETFSKITRTKKLLKVDLFLKYKLNNNAMISYPDYLYESYPGWTTKLLSCPICLCFWSNLILTLTMFPLIYAFFILPVNYVFSLLLYLLIKKLL